MQRVGVKAVFDVSAFSRGANTYIKTINQVNVLNQNVAGSSSMLGRVISTALGNSLAYIATRAIPKAIGALRDFVGEAIAVGADFQQEMAILSSVVDDQTISMGRLSDVAIRVGNDQEILGASAQGAAEAMTLLYKGGLSTNEILGDMQGYLSGTTKLTGALRAAFDLAAATELDVAQAADVAVVALSTFGRELETEAERADFTVASMDYLVRVADASVSEVEDLTGALSYVGPAAQIAGWSLEDVGVAMGLMSNAGMRGTTIGTSLNSMFVDLTETTKKSQTAMDDLGITLFDAEGEMLPIIDIVGQFDVALQGLTSEERIDKLGRIFDIRGARAMNVLLESGMEGWNDMAGSIDNAMSTSDRAAIRMDTLIGKQEILGSTMETLKIQIQKALDPALQSMVEVLNEVLVIIGPPLVELFGRIGESLSNMVNDETVESLRNLGKFLELLRFGLEEGYEPLRAISTALGVAFGVEAQQQFDAVASKVQEVIGVFRELGSGISEAFSQISAGNIGEGLSGLGEAIWNAIPEGVQERISEFVSGIVEKFNEFISSDVVTRTVEIFNELKPALAGVAAALTGGAVVSAIGSVAGAIATLGPGIAGVVATVGTLINPVTAVLAAIGVGVALIVDNWGKLKPIFDAVSEGVKNVMGQIGKFAPALEAIPLLNVFDDLKGSLGQLGEALQPVLPLLKQAATIIGTVLVGALVVVVGIISSVIAAVLSARESFLGAVRSILAGVTQAIAGIINVFTGLYDTIGGLVEGLITGDFSRLKDGFQRLKTGVTQILEGLGQAIVSSVSGWVATMKTLVLTLVTSIVKFFTTLWQELVGGSIIPDMINAIIQWFVKLPLRVLAILGEFIANAIMWFVNLNLELIVLITELVMKGVQLFVDFASDVSKAISDWVTEMVGKFADLVKGVVSKISEFVKDVLQKFSDFREGISERVSNIITDIKDFVSDFTSAGKDLIGGLWSGIKSKFDSVIGKVKELASQLPAAVKKVLGIDSDSKVMIQIGGFIASGLETGIERSMEGPIRAIGNTISGMQRVANSAAAGGVTNNYYSTSLQMNPSYSQVQSEASVYYDAVAALQAVRN